MSTLDISRQIPPRAKVVVEFGATSDLTARNFLMLQPACRWTIVTMQELETEEDSERVENAEDRITVFYGDMGESSFEAREGFEEVDALLVRAEALEAHGADWRGCLSRLFLKLAPNGKVILETPNPSALPRLLSSLRGEEQSAAPGIQALSDFLRMQGLNKQRILAVRTLMDKEIARDPKLPAFLKALQDYAGSESAIAKERILSSAFLVEAQQKQEKDIYLYSILGETAACSRVRVTDAFAMMGTDLSVQAQSIDFDKFIGWPKTDFPTRIFLRQRMRHNDPQQARSFVNEMRRLGWLSVCEWDDSPAMTEGNPMPNHEALAQSDFLEFRACHAVQTSTEFLAKEFRAYCPVVKVFPNALEKLPPERDRSGKADRPLTVFFGAINRENEWQSLVPYLNKLADRLGDRILFKILIRTECFDMLDTPNKEFVGRQMEYNGRYIPFDEYWKVLQTVDINLLPLAATDFNRKKSDLKFIESAACGAVSLASPTIYEASIVDGLTGYICRKPEDFVKRIEELAEDRERHAMMAHAAYRYVRDHRMLSQIYEQRLAWYRDLGENYEELDRMMLERCAKIKGWNDASDS